MRRTAKDNRDLPHPRPVQKIELDGAHTKGRFIAAVLLIILGGAAIAYGFTKLMTPQIGWQEIKASAGDSLTCGDDFVFLYDVGSGGMAASAEARAVTALYSQACRRLYQVFDTEAAGAESGNLYDLNHHPNEIVTVDEVLYRALEQVQRSGSRAIYLGPVYYRYEDLFYCEDDSQLVDFDPYLSGEVREEYAAVAAFAGDPQSIDVELLGDNQARLNVSADCLAYVKTLGTERFLDFGWLKSAFEADYLAQVMLDNGFTNGVISSVDGFVRNLDSRGQTYSLNLYDLPEDQVILAASMEYQGPMSLAVMRSFPTSGADGARYYRLRDGRMCTMYLDPADGRCKASASSLACYSQTQGCAGLALDMAPAFISDELRVLEGGLKDLRDKQVQYVCCLGERLLFNDPEVKLTNIYNVDGLEYFTVDMNDPANYSG